MDLFALFFSSSHGYCDSISATSFGLVLDSNSLPFPIFLEKSFCHLVQDNGTRLFVEPIGSGKKVGNNGFPLRIGFAGTD